MDITDDALQPPGHQSTTHFVAAAIGGLVVGAVLIVGTQPTAPAAVPPAPDTFPEEAQLLQRRLHQALWNDDREAAGSAIAAIESRARQEQLGPLSTDAASRRIESLVGAAEAEVQAFLGKRRGDTKIHVDVDSVDLSEVMEQIGRRVGVPILVDPNVQETVSVSLRQIPWREAVDVVARMTRCEVQERGNGILLLTQPPKVTIQFTDANVRTVLQLLAAYSGQNIIITPDVTGDLSLDLKEIEWMDALRGIARGLRCKVYRVGPDLTIVSKAELPEVALLRPAPPAPKGDPLGDRIRRLRTALEVGRVTLRVDGARAQEVVDRIAAQSGAEIELDPDLADKPVRLHADRLPWRHALDAIAHQLGGRIERRGQRVLLGIHAAKRLTAFGAPADAWFKLLAQVGDLPLRVVPAARQRPVTVDLRDLDPKAAALASAVAIGCELREQPSAHEVRPRSAAPRRTSPRRVKVIDPEAGELKVVYQGSAVLPDLRLALLNGLVHREGEALRLPDGQATGLTLKTVTSSGVVLRQASGAGETFTVDAP